MQSPESRARRHCPPTARAEAAAADECAYSSLKCLMKAHIHLFLWMIMMGRPGQMRSEALA